MDHIPECEGNECTCPPSRDHVVSTGFGERVDTFFTKDVAPRWASNHGPLYGHYRDK